MVLVLFLRYMILPTRDDMKWTRIGKTVPHITRKHIFERVGIMLHGKHSFCTKFACIIKVRYVFHPFFFCSLNCPFMCFYFVKTNISLTLYEVCTYSSLLFSVFFMLRSMEVDEPSKLFNG